MEDGGRRINGTRLEKVDDVIHLPSRGKKHIRTIMDPLSEHHRQPEKRGKVMDAEEIIVCPCTLKKESSDNEADFDVCSLL
jgi:hypothetical protein